MKIDIVPTTSKAATTSSSKPHKQTTSNTPQERDFIFGGGRHLAPNYEEFNTDDTSINSKVAAYLRTALATQHFGRDNWGGEESDGESEVLNEWTGIVGQYA